MEKVYIVQDNWDGEFYAAFASKGLARQFVRKEDLDENADIKSEYLIDDGSYDKILGKLGYDLL